MYRKNRLISLFLVANIVVICCLAGCKKEDMSLKLNESCSIRGITGYKRSFGDLNEEHLRVAQTVGTRPLASREEVGELKEKLQHITTNGLYVVDLLAHSIPHLILGTVTLLDTIGYNSPGPLTAKDLNPDETTATPVLRTKGDVKRLRRRNVNASGNSAHFYGAISDVGWKRFQKVEDEGGRPLWDVSSDTLKLVSSEVLRDLKKTDKCYIKYELKQDYFHIITRM